MVGQDVAEIMLALIHDEAWRHNHQEVPEGKSDEELADQPTPPAGDENLEDPANSDEQAISVPAAVGLTTAPADDQLAAQSSAHELPSTQADEKAAASTTAQKLPFSTCRQAAFNTCRRAARTINNCTEAAFSTCRRAASNTISADRPIPAQPVKTKGASALCVPFLGLPLLATSPRNILTLPRVSRKD